MKTIIKAYSKKEAIKIAKELGNFKTEYVGCLLQANYPRYGKYEFNLYSI